ncbi:MAG: hypothetical protein MHMPM18_002649 [Marteilia pararefringens]
MSCLFLHSIRSIIIGFMLETLHRSTIDSNNVVILVVQLTAGILLELTLIILSDIPRFCKFSSQGLTQMTFLLNIFDFLFSIYTNIKILDILSDNRNFLFIAIAISNITVSCLIFLLRLLVINMAYQIYNSHYGHGDSFQSEELDQDRRSWLKKVPLGYWIDKLSTTVCIVKYLPIGATLKLIIENHDCDKLNILVPFTIAIYVLQLIFDPIIIAVCGRNRNTTGKALILVTVMCQSILCIFSFALNSILYERTMSKHIQQIVALGYTLAYVASLTTSPDSSSQNSEIDIYGHHHDLDSEDELEETFLFPAVQQQFRHEATLTDIIDTPPTYNEAMNQIREFMNTDSQRRPLQTDPTPVIEVELPPPGYEEAMNLIRYSVNTDSPTLPLRTDTTPSIIGLSPPENEETLYQMNYSDGINSRKQPIDFSTVLMSNVAHRDSRDNTGRGNENAGTEQ